MQRELTNGAQSLIDGKLRNRNPAARSRARMKMGHANRLRHEYQHRAEVTRIVESEAPWPGDLACLPDATRENVLQGSRLALSHLLPTKRASSA